MLCQSCSNLLFTYTNRKCLRCQGNALTSISVLCETCSNKDKICAVCLKKTENSTAKKISSGGCRCGKK